MSEIPYNDSVNETHRNRGTIDPTTVPRSAIARWYERFRLKAAAWMETAATTASWHVQLQVFNTPISNQAMICWYLYRVPVGSDFAWFFVIYSDLLWLPMISRYLSQAFLVDSQNTSHFLVCLGTGCTWSALGKGDGQEKEDVHLACFFSSILPRALSQKAICTDLKANFHCYSALSTFIMYVRIIMYPICQKSETSSETESLLRVIFFPASFCISRWNPSL